MYISKIQVSNFRLLRDISINCEKDLSLIIGKNNCGKTSLLSVLNKCIGKTTENGNFDYFDFSIAFQNKLFDVVKEKSAFDENELKGIQVDIYIDYDEKDDLTNISNPNVLNRTKKLFYVCCTRAMDNLVVYCENPTQEMIENAKQLFGAENCYNT